jgi:hypothetical protein
MKYNRMYQYERMLCMLLLLSSLSFCRLDAQDGQQGAYFVKKIYVHASLPVWATSKDLLPSPVYEEDTLLVKTYWKAWELAFNNFYEPSARNGFVSPFIDAAFNNNIFLWDACFMTLFCNYAHPLVPGIGTLDNFYAKQHPSGEICREISRYTGKDCDFWVNRENRDLFSRWGYTVPENIESCAITYKGREIPTPRPLLTLDGMNHPILAWAEWESFLLTGDSARLQQVWQPLVKYYQAFQKYLRQGNGLYMTDWASMDNSQRNPLLKGGGTGIDISCEMVLFARKMVDIAGVLGKPQEMIFYEKEASSLSVLINQLMWDGEKKFYMDLTASGQLAGVKTVAAYWALLSGVASPLQAGMLASHLNNPQTFGRLNPVPTLSADESLFAPYGDYWRGSVWAPTNTVVIRGLERYGYNNLAHMIAMKHLHLVADVYKKTGTIWENYAPDSTTYGLHIGGKPVVKDFVGWSGIAPIMYFLEYAIGLKADAPHNELKWTVYSNKKSGCRNFRFNKHIVSLLAIPVLQGKIQKTELQINSDSEFALTVNIAGNKRVFGVKKGQNIFHCTNKLQ